MGRSQKWKDGQVDEGFDGIAVIDRLKIADRIARYSWAIDAGDLDAYLECFTASGVLRHPRPDGSPGEWVGHEGIGRFVGRGFSHRATQTYGHQHQISAHRLTHQGKHIKVDAYATVMRHEFHRQYWPRGPSWRMGTWHALFHRESETWRIADLDVRMWTDTAFGAGAALQNRGPGMPGVRE